MADYTDMKCAYLADGKIVAGIGATVGNTTGTTLAVGTPENFSGVSTYHNTSGTVAGARANAHAHQLGIDQSKFSSADLNSKNRAKAGDASAAKAALKACQGPPV